MKFNILTLFPKIIENMSFSILEKSIEEGIISINTINFREYSKNKHKKVDDYPYGGGAGMLLSIQPIDDALTDLNPKRVIYLTPRGKKLNQEMLNELAKEEELTILCGHYEGVDQRVIDKWVTDEISIGDYVLTGGELPAMILVDGISRLIDGVIKEDSYKGDSHYNGLLEYDQYTRPFDYKGMKVPEVLISGNHKKIDEYRLQNSLDVTKKKRPDMYRKYIEKNKKTL